MPLRGLEAIVEPVAAKAKRARQTSRGKSRPGTRRHFAATSLGLVVAALAATLLLTMLTTDSGASERRRAAAGNGAARGVSGGEGGAAASGAASGAPPGAGQAADGTGAAAAAYDALAEEGKRLSAAAEPQAASGAAGGSAMAARGGGSSSTPPAGPEAGTAAAKRRLPVSYRPPLEPPKGGAKGRLVLVIDDVGYSLSELEPFLALPFPLSLAVLPGLPHSEEAARRIKAAGKELLLHQPMEASGGQDPGPRAIYLSTPPEEAARLLEENLDSLPGAKGVNNHMGSAVTREERLMEPVLEVVKRRGIYYLDSLTASGTATSGVASRERIRYWERDVFLDNSPDRVSIVRYIEEGKKKAEKGGPAVMIGHVWSADLAQTLADLYPELVAEGFSFSTISKIMIEEADENTGD